MIEPFVSLDADMGELAESAFPSHARTSTIGLQSDIITRATKKDGRRHGGGGEAGECG